MNKKWTAGLLISLLVVAGCGGSGDKKTENKAPAKDEIVITAGNNLAATAVGSAYSLHSLLNRAAAHLQHRITID